MKHVKLDYMYKVSQAIKFIARKFLDLPTVSKWLNKHPRTYRQLTERLTSRHFTGLPLTIFVIVFLYVFSLLLGIVQDYLAKNGLTSADVRIDNLLYFFRSNTLLHFFYFITLFAESAIVITLSVILSIFLWVRKQRIYVFCLLFALMVGEGLTFSAKHIFQRQRPDVFLRAITEDSFSFPSGHATTAVLFYGFLAYLIIRNYRSLKTLATTLSFLALFVVLIDLSRLYLGVHYLSDVIAGNLVGFTSLILSIGITEWWIARKPELTPSKVSSFQVTSILLFAIVSVSIMYFLANPPTNKSKMIIPTEINTSDVLSLFEDKRLNHFTETLTGANQEPISLIVISPEACFIPDINLGNWDLADNISLSTSKSLVKRALFNQSYPTAPMTPSFYNSEPHDYGFEKQTETNSVRARHHARFWKTQYKTPEGVVYVGTVSLDTGIKWGITHTISPDIDTERDVFVSDMKKSGIVSEGKLIPLISPTLGNNFAGDEFFTNGKAAYLVFSECNKSK